MRLKLRAGWYSFLTLAHLIGLTVTFTSRVIQGYNHNYCEGSVGPEWLSPPCLQTLLRTSSNCSVLDCADRYSVDRVRPSNLIKIAAYALHFTCGTPPQQFSWPIPVTAACLQFPLQIERTVSPRVWGQESGEPNQGLYLSSD